MNKLVEMMGLTLDESEAVETLKINQEIFSVESSALLYFQSKEQALFCLTYRLEKTQEVYLQRREFKKALEEAITSKSDVDLWQGAFQKAKLAEEVELSLLVFRLDLVMHKANYFSTMILLVKFLLELYLPMDKGPEQKLLLSNLLCLFFSIPAITTLYSNLKVFELKILSFNFSLVDEVLSLAEKSGIHFKDFSGELLVDSNSLISLLINKENNAKKLEQDESIHIPENMCCMITAEAMTDPVYSEDKSGRFERLAILKWLEKRNSHPCTNQPLYAGDLKRDFPLKRDIDKFTQHEVKKYERANTKKAQFQQFLFQPADESLVDNTLEINDQQMLNSTIGQASNTYKDFVNTRFGA